MSLKGGTTPELGSPCISENKMTYLQSISYHWHIALGLPAAVEVFRQVLAE